MSARPNLRLKAGGWRLEDLNLSVDEFELIETFLRPIAGSRADVVLGIGDDGAIVQPAPNEELVVVVDTIVAGVHFPTGLGAAEIGYRAVAVNLSDIAAMGAEPQWATLALTLPDSDETWLREFAQGLQSALAPYHVALIGGDTTRGPLTITVQVIGSIPRGAALTRRGARAGDIVCVSGTLGDAAAGLAIIQRGPGTTAAEAYLVSRFLRPTPRLGLGAMLRGLATSCIDISDGLLADLSHLARGSHCGAEIRAAELPLSSAMRAVFNDADAVTMAASGGDDYELCFTVPPDQLAALMTAATPLAAIQPIGLMTSAVGTVVLLDSTGQPLRLHSPGYRHFSGRAAEEARL